VCSSDLGIALGAGYGLHSLAKKRETQRLCPMQSAPCSSEGVEAADAALTAGDRATVAFVAGAVGLAGGAVLWVLGGPSERARAADERALLQASVSIGLGTLQLSGYF
jgi:hypothetical protein